MYNKVIMNYKQWKEGEFNLFMVGEYEYKKFTTGWKDDYWYDDY